MKPYVITISRQFGSGGAYLGYRLAKRLGIYYIDREIISEMARRLKLPEFGLSMVDEKPSVYWEVLMANGYIGTAGYSPPKLFIPTNINLFEAQSEIIKKMAEEKSCVMIGRGCSHILKDNPRHLSVLLHAGIPFRKKRVEDLYEVSGEKALKLIKKYDGERADYIRQVTGHDWLDANNYHLCFDTGRIGLDTAEEMIVNFVQDKFAVKKK
ncbi:MAG: cytidylate kinase-like family protein [Desulfotomaculaceae bacterium]|nr:cytidylate kinase-like family protein [Desulfotomaculaceae bacterium]